MIAETLRAGHGNALQTFKERLTWRTVARRVAELDTVLSASGLPSGSTVTIPGRSDPSVATLCLGLVASARCAAILNPFQPTATMIEGARGIGADAWLIAEADLDEAEFRAEDVVFVFDGAGRVRRHSQGPIHPARPLRVDHRLILSTSGTTGDPKRVVIADSTLAQAVRDIAWINIGFGDRPREDGSWAPLVQYSPLAHVGGALTLIRAATQARTTMLIAKFDPHAWSDVVAAERLATTGLPPAMMRMVLDANVPQQALASLVSVWSGSAPVRPETVEAFEARYGVPVLGNYGATEFCGPIASWTLNDHRRFGGQRAGAVGRIDPLVAEARVRSPETATLLPVGSTGLLEVRVPRVGNAWMRTTDLAHLDGDGFLYLHGRADDFIVRGGFKLSPHTIAAALRSHHAVADVAVVGIEDARLGQVPVAAVEVREGGSIAGDELIALVRQQLPAYFAPVEIRFVHAVPRTPAMKIDRSAVRLLFPR